MDPEPEPLAPAVSLEPEREPGIGLVVPFDFRADRDCWRYLEGAGELALHVTRTPAEQGPVSLALAEAVGATDAVVDAVARLLPVTDRVVYGCCSGTFVGGLEQEERLRAAVVAAGAAEFATASGAMVSALRLLGARRVAVLTPYDRELSAALARYLREAGVESLAVTCLGLRTGIHRIGTGQLARAIAVADRPDAEAVLVACTGVASYEAIVAAEAALDKPVVAANQAVMRAALGMADALGRVAVPHRLFAAGRRG